MGKILFIEDNKIDSDEEEFIDLKISLFDAFYEKNKFTNYDIKEKLVLIDSTEKEMPIRITPHHLFSKGKSDSLYAHFIYEIECEGILLKPLEDESFKGNILSLRVPKSYKLKDEQAMGYNFENGYTLIRMHRFNSFVLYKDKTKTKSFKIVNQHLDKYMIDEDLRILNCY